jgi:DnaK suppressor protein
MVSKAFLQKAKAALLLQKKELLSRASQSNEVDMDGDETDEVQGNMIAEMSNQLNNRDLFKLNQIDEALRRISESTYGLCQDCEDKIPDKRLAVNPYCLTCVSCAEEREAEEKQRKRF